MRIAHIADTHLGYSGSLAQPMVEDPFSPGLRVTRRFADILLAFETAISRILALDVDVVLHCGDFFESPRPAPSVQRFAMEQLDRLSVAGIPVVIVEGHHSFPRQRSIGHVLPLLNYVRGVRALAESAEAITVLPNLVIHGVPHTAVNAGALPPPPKRRGQESHLLAMHAQVNGNPLYGALRPAPAVDLAGLADRYDYVALGHHHHFTQPDLIPNAFYCGSPTMVSWTDFRPGADFGFNLVDLEPDRPPTIERVLTGSRTLNAYGLDDAAGLSAPDILEKIANQVNAANPLDAYCEVVIRNIEPPARRELNLRAVEDLFGNSAGTRVEVNSARTSWAEVQRRIQDVGTPAERFEALAAMTGGDDDFRAEVRDLGLRLLDHADALLIESEA